MYDHFSLLSFVFRVMCKRRAKGKIIKKKSMKKGFQEREYSNSHRPSSTGRHDTHTLTHTQTKPATIELRGNVRVSKEPKTEKPKLKHDSESSIEF